MGYVGNRGKRERRARGVIGKKGLEGSGAVSDRPTVATYNGFPLGENLEGDAGQGAAAAETQAQTVVSPVLIGGC